MTGIPMTSKTSWDEVVNHVADQIEARIRGFNRNDFVKWYSTKEYVGKPFDWYLIYTAYKIQKRLRNDYDNLVLITGLEGSGKSTLGINFSSLIDEKFNEDNVGIDEVKAFNLLRDSKKYSSVLLDEGGNLMFSREAMKTQNRDLMKLFMLMRARNLNIVVCIPNFYMVDSYIRQHRVNLLLHVKERGEYRLFTRDGIKDLNDWGNMKKGVMGVRIKAYKFHDGLFNKGIPKNFNYQNYLAMKDLYISSAFKGNKLQNDPIYEGARLVPLQKLTQALGLKNKTMIWRLLKIGEIKGKKIAGKWFVSREDYEKLVKV